MKKIVVIARYNEDISWVEHLKIDYVVYNKGEDWPYDFPCIKAENYGREGETFVRFIIEFYEFLKSYDLVSFVQGNPFDHCPQCLSILNENVGNEIFALSDFINRDIYNDNKRIFGIHPSIINLLLNLNHLNQEFIPTYQKIDFDNNEITNQEPNKNWFLDNIIMCTILGLDHIDKDNYWAVGAQYTVPSFLIHNKSIEWCQNLQYLFDYLCKENNEYDWTYILERIWPLIWNHSTN